MTHQNINGILVTRPNGTKGVDTMENQILEMIDDMDIMSVMLKKIPDESKREILGIIKGAFIVSEDKKKKNMIAAN